MRRAFFDLHLHSCLSPCGDADMTPNNMINMALLKGLDIIAITDHNSCKNCAAAMRASEGKDIVVIPGMELCTAEEVHVVCLFPDLNSAEGFGDYIYGLIPDILNKPRIFGEQVIIDENDRVTGSEEKLLIVGAGVDIFDVPELVGSYGGFCFPAHIDKSSTSILSNLGAIPPELNFKTVEVQHPEMFFANGANKEFSQRYRVITNSDAHCLEDIAEPVRTLDLESLDFYGLKKALELERVNL